MKEIFKYPIETKEEQKIWVTGPLCLLCVQIQMKEPFIWALVDTCAPSVPVDILIHGTGNPINHSIAHEHRYLGTYQLDDGALVFHVFYKKTWENEG